MYLERCMNSVYNSNNLERCMNSAYNSKNLLNLKIEVKLSNDVKV